MTAGLGYVLGRFAGSLSRTAAAWRGKEPDFRGLGESALRDLNLPPEVAGRLQARQDAEDLRRRVFW